MHLFPILTILLATTCGTGAWARINPDGMSSSQLRQVLAAETQQNHHSLGYSTARKELMGRLALEQTQKGYVIRDVYCEEDYDSRRFGGHGGPAPGRIPDDRVLNTEHTWPQSRFGGASRDMQKSDLHHLFPSDSQINGIRGNHPFGEVAQPERALKCPVSKAGRNSEGVFVFEPPRAHRGNVARALFYFSVRYRLDIDATQEAVLRQWNEDDPVDPAEMERNDEIEKLQGNRNPFIDQPELVKFISDF